MTVINTQYLAHMSKYANAVYGLSLFLYSFVMMRRVWLNSYLESNAHSLMQQINRNLRETRMKDYNQLKITLQSLVQEIGGSLIYCTDANIIGRTPWFIAYDNTFDSVVISIRGTWSVKDVVTDILLETQSLDEAGRQFGFDGEGEYTHRGMYLVAMEVMSDLLNMNILPAIFEKKPIEDNNIMLPPELLQKITPSTKLVIVGHSLGGGAAALMSLFLQHRYPNTCCAFDPPGETLSPGLRDRSAHFITTTVFGHDIFPRVSSYTYSILQDNIVGSLCYCKLSKYRFFYMLAMNKLKVKSMFYNREEEMSDEKKDVLRKWMLNSMEYQQNYAKKCLLPGNIIYIKFDKLKVYTKKGKKKDLVKENPVHAVAEEFLDLRLGHHFWFNHWVFLVRTRIESEV